MHGLIRRARRRSGFLIDSVSIAKSDTVAPFYPTLSPFVTLGQGKRDVEEAASSFGLSGALSQLSELKLGELLNTPPPGFDEAAAIAKVHQLVTRGEYARFSRIVFDTAPTGHTLRLLTGASGVGGVY